MRPGCPEHKLLECFPSKRVLSLIGQSLVSHCSIIGHSLVNHWSIIGQSLVNHWSIIGQSLVSHWSIIGQSLVNHWSSPSPPQRFERCGGLGAAAHGHGGSPRVEECHRDTPCVGCLRGHVGCSGRVCGSRHCVCALCGRVRLLRNQRPCDKTQAGL